MNDSGTPTPVLECHSLRKVYREGPRELRVLDGVELVLARGERLGGLRAAGLLHDLTGGQGRPREHVDPARLDGVHARDLVGDDHDVALRVTRLDRVLTQAPDPASAAALARAA